MSGGHTLAAAGCCGARSRGGVLRAASFSARLGRVRVRVRVGVGVRVRVRVRVRVKVSQRRAAASS